LDSNDIAKISASSMFLKGTIIAGIITVPSIISLFVAWHIFGDLILSAIVATIVHFIGMAFSIKFSKKIFKNKIKN
jgi:hypothetical protein